jgi:hypothetical protein
VNTKRQGAFAGAEGYGAETTHARNEAGAQVLRVTNLNNSGAGSLRSALESSVPRIILFDISGQIDLSSICTVSNGNFALFGQTAPSPGITVRGEFRFVAPDGVIQHIRARAGWAPANTRSLLVRGPSNRVVVDHCSASWSNDDNTGGGSQPSNITWSHVISSESERGMLLSEASTRISVIRQLFAHIQNRCPNSKAGTTSTYVNCYLYNCGFPGGDSPMQVVGGNNPGPVLLNVMGTFCKDGLSNDGETGIFFAGNAKDGSKVYMDDNTFTRVPPVNDVSGGSVTIVGSPPHALPAVLSVLPSSALETRIVADVGAQPLDRDPVDTRIINDVINGTGVYITNENSVGGYPSLAENTYVHDDDPDWIALGLGNAANHFKKDIHPFYSRIELYVAKWTPAVQDVFLIPDI